MVSGRKKTADVLLVSGAYSADLRGRQSVRTTFRLSPHCIDALSLLAGQLGIKQKSLFDHLVDDIQALRLIAREIEARDEPSRENRVAKTYVISRRTLDNLEQVASRYQAPRDSLVEFSIERIMPLIKEERKKHENRKTLRGKLDRFMQDGRELLDQADGLLDRDDPVFEKVLHMVHTVKSGCDEIDGIISKGRRLEEF